jgi:hypothetical protein
MSRVSENVGASTCRNPNDPHGLYWDNLWSLSFWPSHQTLLSRLCYITCPSHPPWLDHSNYTWRRVQVMKVLIMQFSTISSPLFPNVLHSKLFSNVFSQCSSFNARGEVPHQYKTTRKITVLYILICTFLDRRCEDKSFWIGQYQALAKFNMYLICLWIKSLCHSYVNARISRHATSEHRTGRPSYQTTAPFGNSNRDGDSDSDEWHLSVLKCNTEILLRYSLLWNHERLVCIFSYCKR